LYYYSLQIDTAPIDPRFPATNQARNCFVKYNEAHKCYAEKGEDAPECARIARDYRSICPTEWVAAWNEARENGTWFGKY
jgi:cytochrome c oxidase subunit 6b